MNRTVRTLIAFAVAPMGAGIVGFIWSLAWGRFHNVPSIEALQIGILGIVVGAITALFLGFPLFLLLRYLHRSSLVVYIAAGAMLGVVVFESIWPGAIRTLVFERSVGAQLDQEVWSAMIGGDGLCALAGICAAWLFWKIARPDVS